MRKRRAGVLSIMAGFFIILIVLAFTVDIVLRNLSSLNGGAGAPTGSVTNFASSCNDSTLKIIASNLTGTSTNAGNSPRGSIPGRH